MFTMDLRSGYNVKSKAPTVRQISWISTIPQFITLTLLIGLSVLLWWPTINFLSVSVGALIYLIYSIGSRRLLTRHHRRGIDLVNRGKYTEAIEAYERSYDFFSKYAWVDRFRALTMMTPVKQTFHEMALLNIAYCYVQLGDKAQTKSYYQRVLDEFPDSAMAQSALRFIETIEA